MEDHELAGRLATDLDGAFATLVEVHRDRVYSIALRLLGDPEDAEEVAQDVLVRAYRAIGSYPTERIRDLRLRPWLAAIAVAQARNRRRRASDRQPPLRLVVTEGRVVGDSAGNEPSAEAAAGRRADTQRWASLLAGLPDRYRVPLVLRYVDDLSYAEMAEALGRPEGTLKAQVHRGLGRLREAWLAAERQEETA